MVAQRIRHAAGSFRSVKTCWAALAALGMAFLLTGKTQAANLVAAAVDNAQRIELNVQHPNWVSPKNDHGAVANDLPLTHLTALLKRSPEQQTAFEQFLKDQQNPSSANFHHWLNPTELGEKFGASTQDIAALVTWLQAQGLHVDTIANSHMRINFSGSAAQVGAAFQTHVHTYLVRGESRIAPFANPRIPVAFSALVKSINGLTTIHEHGNAGHGSAQFNARATQADQPGASFCSNGACNNYIFPADFAKIYDINPVYNQGIDGSGQTIAILGLARVYLPDIENFQKLAGLTQKDPVIVIPPNGVDPGPAASSGGPASENQLEATIDVTRAGSVAPGATIDLVVSGPTATSIGLGVGAEYVVDTNPPPAQILSMSFGDCEAGAGQSGVDFYDNLFSQAAAEGISVFIISGDSGAAGCDPYNATPPSNQMLNTNYICASEYATCVGGTQFADSTNPGQFWGSNSNGYLSALGYIPEGAWNEPLGGNIPVASATGGGVSMFAPTPWWQVGPGVPGKQGRYTPDVSFSASGHNGYFACVAASGSSCVPDSNGNFNFEYIYGTSASTPDMAGIAALLNQKMGGAQGNLNPRLYALAATPSNRVFHDITVASSGVADCDVGIPSLCNNSTPAPDALTGGLAGYLVGSGYDLATGLGSLDVANLLKQWTASATSVNLNQHGLTGSWYDPNTAGQGFMVEVYPDAIQAGQGTLAMGWYTFDVTATGGQRWYALQGPATKDAAFASLGIFTATGGNFSAAPKAIGSQVGTATLWFSDCTHGSLTFNFTDGSGRSGTIPLERLDTNVTCTPAGDSGTAAPGYLLSGAWYNEDTDGQGFFFDISPAQTTFFGAWYTFAPNSPITGDANRQRWYAMQNNAFAVGATAVSADIFEPTGGSFNRSGGVVGGAAAGNADITFKNCNAITLHYDFAGGTNAGLSGSIDLKRVGPVPAGCNF